MRGRMSSRGRSRRVMGAGAVVMAAATMAAGCGHSNNDQAQVSTGGKPTAAVALASATTKTDDAGAAQFRFTMSMSGSSLESGGLTITGSGGFDPVTQRSDGTVDLSAFMSQLATLGGDAGSATGDGVMHEVIADGHLYIQWPLLTKMLPAGKTWVEADDLGKLTGSSAMSGMTSDASTYLDLLEGIGSVTRVGTEEIDGQATTHYRATIDAAKVLAKLPKSSNADVSSLLDKVGKDTFPIDVWVGNSDNLVHQLALGMDTGSLTSGAVNMSANVTVTFSDFGQPVTVTVPPADQVASFSSLIPFGH